MSVWIIGLLLWIAPAVALALLLTYTVFRIRAKGKAGQSKLPKSEPAPEAALAEARPQDDELRLDA